MPRHVQVRGGHQPRVATRSLALAAFLLLVLTGASCWLDRSGLIPETTGAGGYGAGTTAGGAGPGGSATGTISIGGQAGTGGSGATGGAGGEPPIGGAPPLLVNSGLLVRYHIDEASSGTVPTTLRDAAPSPLDLPISYSGAMSYTEVSGNRALQWASASAGGSAWTAVDATKIHAALHGSVTGTIEVVVAITGVTANYSRLSHIGLDQELGRFTLTANSLDRLFLVVNDSVQVGNWPFPLAPSGRTVLHAVFDSSHGTPTDRTRLYADGARVTGNIGSLTTQNLTIDLASGRHFTLGNRQIGGRSFQGELYYAALYESALSDAEISHNATLLLVDDD